MAKKDQEIKEKKQKKGNFFKQMKAELKKMVWPTPKELAKSTIAVISFVIIIAVIVFILDLVFDGINKYGVSNVQDKILNSFNANKDNEDNQDNETSENSQDIENNENNQETTNIENNENAQENNSEETTNTEDITQNVN